MSICDATNSRKMDFRKMMFFENRHFWLEKKCFDSKSKWCKMMSDVCITVQECSTSLIRCISGQKSYFRLIPAELSFFEKGYFFNFFKIFGKIDIFHHLSGHLSNLSDHLIRKYDISAFESRVNHVSTKSRSSKILI